MPRKSHLKHAKSPPLKPHIASSPIDLLTAASKHSTLIIILVTACLYFQVKDFKFLSWDDQETVQYNYRLQPPTLDTLAYYWTPYVPKEYKLGQDIYIPLTYTVWSGLALLSDLFFPGTSYTVIHPAVYHLANVAVHILTALIIRAILLLLLAKMLQGNLTPQAHRWLATIGALIYAIHPIQVEAVGWISGMKDLLCAFFGYLSVYYWIKLLTHLPKNLLTHKHHLLALIFFILASCSKPQAINIPLITLILAIGIYRIPARTLIIPAIPWLVIALATAILAKLLQPDKIIYTLSPIWTRPLVALDAFAFYLSKVILPINLCFDYSRTPEYIYQTGKLFYTWLLPAAIITAACFSSHRRLLLTLIALFGAGFASVSGLIPFFSQNVSTVSDRYMLFPMLAVAIAASWSIAKLIEIFPKRTSIIHSLSIITLLALCPLTYRQIQIWENDITFYNQSAKINPRSYRALNNLALNLYDRGQYQEAEKLLLQCAEINGTDPLTFSNLGMVQFKQNKISEARASIQRALELKPDSVYALNHMGMIEAAQGQYSEAIHWYQKAHKEAPQAFPFVFNLANTALKAHREDIAIEAFKKAVEINPDHTQSLNDLGALYIKQNRLSEALPFIEKAIYLDTTANPGFIQNWFTLRQRMGLPPNPEHPITRLHQADLQIQNKNPQSALIILNSTLTEHPEIISAYSRLCSILKILGRQSEADAIDLQALSLARKLGYRQITYALESSLISRGHPIRRTVIQDE